MEADTVEGLLGLSATSAGKSSYTDLAPDIRLSYQASDDLQFYLAVSEGYRGGGLNAGEPIGSVLGPNQPLRGYSGDALWTYEIGARASMFDDTLQLSGAIFYNDWRRIQTDALVMDNLPFTGNVGHGRAYGLEADLLYTPLDGLSIRAHMVVNSASLVRPDPTFPAATDYGFPGVPRVRRI
jgi:outer membrane receptor protein involved in Fe transport